MFLFVFISVYSPAVPMPVAAGGSIIINPRNFMPVMRPSFKYKINFSGSLTFL